jgi:hypothetical protein
VSAQAAARVLERSLTGFSGALTAADAAARSGLPTREAEAGLAALSATHGGHLAVTSKGELIYEFPRGLVRGDRPGLLRRIGRAVAKVAYGALRFVVRAWLSVVLIGYALVFAAVLLAVAAKSEDGIGDVLALLLQVLAESLYWTFHPFGVVSFERAPGWVRGRGRRAAAAKLPFYERVNRFVFGPPPPAIDPRGALRAAVGEIRRQRGRVVPADVMRVTGAGREEAERLLLQLVAEHEGEIAVSESGAILYEFPQLRVTAAGGAVATRTSAAWETLAQVPALTGNSVAFNVLFSAINGFNLTMSGVALAQGLTIARLGELIARIGVVDAPPLPPPDGVPLALGLVPLLFSTGLFVLPLLRAFGRRATKARVAHENHVRRLLAVLLAEPEAGRFRFAAPALANALALPAGPPSDSDVERAVRRLGGTVDIGDDGALVYTFDDMAREHAAVRAARALASPEEASPGAVLLSSADEGHGLRDEAAGGDAIPPTRRWS